MGRFMYGSLVKIEIEDRALAHVQGVIVNKLRRGESFQFTWREDVSVGSGRTSVWINPQSALVYKFSGGRTPSLNPAWLEVLAQAANSPTGLYLVPEPDESAVSQLIPGEI